MWCDERVSEKVGKYSFKDGALKLKFWMAASFSEVVPTKKP